MTDTGWYQQPKVHPETGEIVDDISRTAAMRVASDEKLRATKRSTADVIALLEDRQWTRGWLIGLVTGIAGTIIVMSLWALIVG